MTDWIWREHVIIVAADAAAGNALAALLDPDTGGDRTFGGLPLSPAGAAPATHRGISTAATEATRQQMGAVVGAWAAYGLSAAPRYYRCEAATGRLAATNSPTAQAAIGQPWSWDASLADAGLLSIVEGAP